MTETLNEALALDSYGIQVFEGRRYVKVTSPRGLADYPPESVAVDYSGPFEEAQISDEQERDMVESVKRDSGWDVLTGWSLNGGMAIMHPSQYVGGDLADHILDTPGLWTCVSVEMYPPCCDAGDDGTACEEWLKRERCEHADYNPESDAAGWALLHKEITPMTKAIEEKEL